MRPIQLLALAGMGVLAMNNSCDKDAAAPTPEAIGRIVRLETTVDDTGGNPRFRWEIDVTPLSFPGLNGTAYQEIKTFDLSDTATYKVGKRIQFNYQLVPQAQHTPWRTLYERLNTAAMTAWGDRLPELKLSDIELAKEQ